jgi:hypothetical protein
MRLVNTASHRDVAREGERQQGLATIVATIVATILQKHGVTVVLGGGLSSFYVFLLPTLPCPPFDIEELLRRNFKPDLLIIDEASFSEIRRYFIFSHAF